MLLVAGNMLLEASCCLKQHVAGNQQHVARQHVAGQHVDGQHVRGFRDTSAHTRLFRAIKML